MRDEQLIAYFDGWRRLSEWEQTNTLGRAMTPQEKLAAVSGIYRMLPPESIARNENRSSDGFSKLLKTLALLRG